MSTTLHTGLPVLSGTARNRRRRLTAVIALVAALALVGASCTKNAAALDSAMRVNSSRADRGLRALGIDPVLVDKAQAWADHMAAVGNVEHSVLTDGAGSNWRVLGENVGWARSISEMHSMFMNSPAHRANVLNGRYNRVGTGVTVVDGQYYVVQVFAG